MAEVAGIKSFTKDKYRQIPCPLCTYWQKIKIYPYSMQLNNPIRCKRCNAKLILEINESDEFNGNKTVKINLSVTTSVKTIYTPQLKAVANN